MSGMRFLYESVRDQNYLAQLILLMDARQRPFEEVKQ